MSDKDWTAHKNGRANSSVEYLRIVDAVTRLIENHRCGDDPASTARLIVSQLAHTYKLAPHPPEASA